MHFAYSGALAEAFQTTHNAPSSTGLLAEEGEDELRLMVQQMSERILVLEADVNEVQPPPNYSDPPLSPLGPDSPENVVLPESSRLDSVPHAI
ncbi:hypothetical protein C0991_010880 [Blastosporella zonata]|nr:hypothetical protein C0991_010880 [Blastosporella zonata]